MAFYVKRYFIWNLFLCNFRLNNTKFPFYSGKIKKSYLVKITKFREILQMNKLFNPPCVFVVKSTELAAVQT